MGNQVEKEVILVGAGIMSVTLASMLKRLDPSLRIRIIERLDSAGLESSNALNNAGTGHAGLCELNYTSERPDGTVDAAKAIQIFEGFEKSKQFWAHLVREGTLGEPGDFIQKVPHLSFVLGEKNVTSLLARFESMRQHHFFQEMEWTTDWDQAAEWAPLLAQGRDRSQPFALTRVASGTDVNFGALTRSLTKTLTTDEEVEILFSHEVTQLRRAGSDWRVRVRDRQSGKVSQFSAGFVFLGAGGGALPLLQKAGLAEGKGFGGFPVSGKWLICSNPEVVKKHDAKVYGKAAVGAPPMSVPHLDTRYIDGQRSLLFGPFAGFSPKFLKTGHLTDLPASVRLDNLLPMLTVAKDNLPLTIYLIKQVLQSPAARIEALHEFFPEAEASDWKLATAGQRVQIIKKDPKKGGVLQFGTEVVAAADGSMAALLGASPGASTAVSIMLQVLERCFGEEMGSEAWQERLAVMVPSYRRSLAEDAAAYHPIRSATDEVLGLREEAPPLVKAVSQ
ncbi:MAG: malate dehydrogenase (quinone) [Verrucomicrobiota bacterium]